MDLTSPKEIRTIMASHGLSFNKALGQNFLTDRSVLDAIVNGSGVTDRTAVIEVGPGIGCLTQALAEKAGKVICIELDHKLVPYLKSFFADKENVEIIHGDILKVDLSELINNQPYDDIRVVANLPYYITTPILMRLMEENLPIKSITVMVQKEVGDRITAQPGTKDYGALSVAVAYHSEPGIICNVPSSSFIPPPKVDSAVVKMELGKEKPDVDEKLFFTTVKASFAQRRKTLVNALHGSNKFALNKQQLTDIILSLGWNDKVRGETLSLEQFALLANKLTF